MKDKEGDVKDLLITLNDQLSKQELLPYKGR